MAEVRQVFPAGGRAADAGPGRWRGLRRLWRPAPGKGGDDWASDDWGLDGHAGPAGQGRAAAWSASALFGGALLPWAPVALSVGVGLYFALHRDPGGLIVTSLAALFLAFAGLAFTASAALRTAAAVIALIVGGFLLAILRTHMVAAPVLAYATYGPVEGRIVDIDRSFSDQIRVTLDDIALPKVTDAPIPGRVRIALHGEAPGFQPLPGARIRAIARLAPPDGPVEPGGFDFQRLAFFSGLGGVGYTRKPIEIIAPPKPDMALWAFQARMAISTAMQAEMGGGQAAALAAALMTGDRSGVDAASNEAMRASNLSHLISISGLHMGLLTAFVFALFRYGIALVPPLALRLDGKKVAAVGALLAATLYMFLAGPNVATRRAYIQAAVMLAAILCDRRALSLRSVSIAALICLVLEPESLVEPGFQMSFGATAALIVGFERLNPHLRRLPGPLRPLAMTLLSSLIAGTATMPIAAAHFNRIAEYGLLANLLAVPVTGFLVMPPGVVAAILAPLGLAAPALWVQEIGTTLILLIAGWVASLKGAVIPVPEPSGLVLPLIGLGGAVFFLGRSWLRGAGAGLCLAALGLWMVAERPVLLVAGDGSLAGLMTAEGRALSKPKGGGFVASAWLTSDGDTADQAEAAARGAFAGERGALRAEVIGRPLWIFTGKRATERARGHCNGGAILILNVVWATPDRGDCEIFDLRRLRRTGSLAFMAEDGGLRVVIARRAAGYRPWNLRPYRPRAGAGADAGPVADAMVTRPAAPP